MAELITFRIECLALARLCYGKLDPKVIKAQSQLGDAYLMSGLEKQAVEHSSQALQRARDYPLDDVIASASHSLGRAFTRLGEYDKALAALRDALRASNRQHGSSALATCPVLASLAKLHAARGDHQEVIATMTKVWQLKEPQLGTEHVEMMDTYLELARAFFNAEDDTNCQENLDKALSVVETNRDELCLATDPRLALNKIKRLRSALKYDENSDLDEGDDEEDDEQETLPNGKANLKMSWKVADAHCLLAASYKRTVEFDQALTHYLLARDLYRNLEQLQPPLKGGRGEAAARSKVLKIERELATVHIVLEAYDKAATHLRVVLEMQEQNAPGGRFDVQVALTEQRLGDVCTLARQSADAKRHFEKAISLYTTLYGAAHKTVVTVRKRVQTLKLDETELLKDKHGDEDDDG